MFERVIGRAIRWLAALAACCVAAVASTLPALAEEPEAAPAIEAATSDTPSEETPIAEAPLAEPEALPPVPVPLESFEAAPSEDPLSGEAARAEEAEPAEPSESAEPSEPAEPSIWEAQVREELQRDIAERERRAWEQQTAAPAVAQRPRAKAAIAPEPIVSKPLAAPSSAAKIPRLAFAPLASEADRAAARAERDPSIDFELDARRELLAAIGVREEVQAPAETHAGGEAEVAVEPRPRREPPRRAKLMAPQNALDRALASATELLEPVRASARGASVRARELAQRDDVRRGAALAGAALVASWLLARTARRRGDLVVHLVYPTELRGTFRVRLDVHRRRSKRATPHSDAEILKGGTASAREHQLVARETPFRKLPCRRYYLTIDGVLQDPATGAIVHHAFLQRTATVLHRRTVRCDVDATPSTCPVDVQLQWDGRAPRTAQVAVHGQKGGPLEVENGRARLQLPLGAFTIAAGSGDRVAEKRLDVRSYLPTSLEIELGQAGPIVFKACPPAVDAYLAGNLDAAAAALARDGQISTSHRLLARRCREFGRPAEAALHFEAAGEFLEAAELHSTLGNYAQAGELFGRADDPLSAAEMFQLAGEPILAGRAFERVRDFDNAIACYREAGDAASWVEALERRGDIFEAARTALSNGLPTRGIRLLQRVSTDDENYRESCILLADTFERERHFDLAARKLADYVSVSKPDEVQPDIYARLADLHEKSGDIENALDVLESLRLLEPSYPNLATSAERLRKARSAKRHMAPQGLGDGAVMSPTILLADQRYEVLEEIGRGGMGVVSRARDRRLGRVVALKRLSENLRDHPRAVELFLREARAAAALNHPNIVTVYDADQEDGVLFITMELLDGMPLHQLLRRRGRLGSAEIAQIGKQVCAGLEYAHGCGVIHRDIKTANLFVGRDQRVKIMDFGLAKVAEEVRRNASLIGGTPYYMAPEQTLGGDIDHRADLYSLGITLFEVLTGRVPFPDGDAHHHNLHTPPPNPLELAPDADPRLVELILELLEKDPAHRPQSAAEVGRRLALLDPNSTAARRS